MLEILVQSSALVDIRYAPILQAKAITKTIRTPNLHRLEVSITRAHSRAIPYEQYSMDCEFEGYMSDVLYLHTSGTLH